MKRHATQSAGEIAGRVERIHGEALIAAAHTDLIGDVAERQSRGERAVLSRRHAAVFRRGGIRCISDHVIGDTFETQSFPSKALLTAFRGAGPYNPSLLKHALKGLVYMLRDIDQSATDFALATSVEQIHTIAGSGRIAVVLCTQGLGPVEDEPELLEIYHRLGIRVLGMTTLPGNAAVGSYAHNPEYGLSALGQAIIEKAQQLRMVVDVSAVSKRGFWDTVERVQGPLIASATNAYGVCGYPGNFDDRQIEALAQKGGVIAPIANGKLVTDKPEATLADFVDHIDYIADRVGVDHVCFGPDIVEDTFYPLETYRRMFAEQGYWSARYPEGVSNHGELPNVTAELFRRGYTEADVTKILGGNLLRVYAQVWGP